MSQAFNNDMMRHIKFVEQHREGWGVKLTTLRPSDFGPRSFGPSCPCHGKRNMERMGYCLYRCQESGETFQMLVHGGHIAMVPLETGKALHDIR